VFARSVDTACSPANLEVRVVAVRPAQFCQPLHKGGELSPALWIVLARTEEDADAPRPLAPLRARRW
jgi:hypothetical protein